MINNDLSVVPKLFRSYHDLNKTKQKYIDINIFEKMYQSFKVYQNVSVGSKIQYQLNVKDNILDSNFLYPIILQNIFQDHLY